MTEVAPAPVVPSTPGSAPASTDLMAGGGLVAESARARIETLKSDGEFYKKLMQKDLAATAEWSDLHKQGFPAPVEIASAADVDAQKAARNEEQWNGYFAAIKQQFALTPAMQAELRAGVVRSDIYDWAQLEKTRLIKDRGFYNLLVNGDRAANDSWQRVTLLLSLRPVKVA